LLLFDGVLLNYRTAGSVSPALSRRNADAPLVISSFRTAILINTDPMQTERGQFKIDLI
jgi:hypothetical protein